MSLLVIKNRLRIAYALFLLSISACDPPQGLYDAGSIVITAHIINPRTTIHLGDSVAFYFEVPDSVTLNGTRISASIGNKDGGDVEFSASKINSSNSAGFEPYSRECQLYANPGAIVNNSSITFAHLNGKLLSKLYFIPKKKGIYFFDQGPEGYLDLNDQNLLVRCAINFGTVNRNYQMLIDSAGTASRFDMYLRGRINNGWEVYGFRVI